MDAVRVAISMVLSLSCILFNVDLCRLGIARFCRASHHNIIRKLLPPSLSASEAALKVSWSAGSRAPGNDDLEYSPARARACVYVWRWFVKPGMCRTSLRSSAFITNRLNRVNDLKPKSEDAPGSSDRRHFRPLLSYLVSLITLALR